MTCCLTTSEIKCFYLCSERLHSKASITKRGGGAVSFHYIGNRAYFNNSIVLCLVVRYQYVPGGTGAVKSLFCVSDKVNYLDSSCLDYGAYSSYDCMQQKHDVCSGLRQIHQDETLLK